MPTTIPMTRLLNGSRKRPLTTRGEYWLDASWIVRSDTENAMPATVIVAPAMVLSTDLALATVEVRPNGSFVVPAPRLRSTTMPTSARTTAPMTNIIGTTKRLPRQRSARAEKPILNFMDSSDR